MLAARLKHYSLAFQTEVQVRSQASQVTFMVDKEVQGLRLPVIRDSPLSIITVMLRDHVLFIYHRRCMILATNSVVKQSIYHNVSNTVFFSVDLRACEPPE